MSGQDLDLDVDLDDPRIRHLARRFYLDNRCITKVKVSVRNKQTVLRGRIHRLQPQ